MTTTDKKVYNLGGVKGRHEMPVEVFLFEESVLDFDTANKKAMERMNTFLENTEKDAIIRFYPTGLSTVSFGVIAAFVNSVGDFDIMSNETSQRRLEIWEYDRDKNDYVCTSVFGHSSQMNDGSVFEYGFTYGGTNQ